MVIKLLLMQGRNQKRRTRSTKQRKSPGSNRYLYSGNRFFIKTCNTYCRTSTAVCRISGRRAMRPGTDVETPRTVVARATSSKPCCSPQPMDRPSPPTNTTQRRASRRLSPRPLYSVPLVVKYSVNRIKEIQNAAFLSFVVRDSNAKEYIFDGNLPGCYMNYSYHSDEKECHSILVEPEVFREKYGMAENWSTEIFDYDSCPATARMFSWVGTKYLVAIPNLRVNQTAVKCTKTFTLPVEELMTISGFAIERKN